MSERTVAAGWTDQPGTIDDLVMDAHDRGFPATTRTIYDWVGVGLLDHPQRHSRGSEHGSNKALWPWTQRNLFRLLVDKRPQLKTLTALCNVPVAIWLGWGETYILTRQVQRALATWAGKAPNVSEQTMRRQARQFVDFLDDWEMKASRYQRRRLMDALLNSAKERRTDPDLAEALQEVFDPAKAGRTFGSSLMPLTVDDIIGLIESRIRGLQRAEAPASLNELIKVWDLHHYGMDAYAAERHRLVATSIRPHDAAMWKEPNWDERVNNACYHVSVALGGLARGSLAWSTIFDGRY